MKTQQLIAALAAPTPFTKSGIHQILLASCCFSIMLIAIRVFYTGSFIFCFLIWNMFLAYVPYLISSLLFRKPQLIDKTILFIAICIAWLLFIPNSFYIITDLFHLKWTTQMPQWFDLLMILSCAWNGVLLGILSVRQMEKIFTALWLLKNSWLFIYAIMFLNALGVYIGRFLRFNSWDVLTNPFGLVADIANLILHPLQNKDVWAMTFFYSIFMSLLYKAIKKQGMQ
jgi:uncharacterized membrane protein